LSSDEQKCRLYAATLTLVFRVLDGFGFSGLWFIVLESKKSRLPYFLISPGIMIPEVPRGWALKSGKKMKGPRYLTVRRPQAVPKIDAATEKMGSLWQRLAERGPF